MGKKAFFASLLYLLPTLGLLGQGILYLTTQRFMPYHRDALGVEWNELSNSHQGFIIGVIRGMGAGSTSISIAMILLLLIPFRRGERWSYWAIPFLGILFSLLTAYAAYTIDVRTPASTPWLATCGLASVYLLGAIVSYWPSPPARESTS